MELNHPYRAVTIINDCTDDNARMRQEMRTIAALGLSITYLGVPKFSSIAASGNLIDAIDAAAHHPSIVMVNVAPRHGDAKRFKNGTPFGYFFFRDSIVIASVSEATLVLVKKLKLVETIRILEPEVVLPVFADAGLIQKKHIDWILRTQFRSFNFVPRVAEYLALHKNELPGEDFPLSEIADEPPVVWWIDNFGNLKTSLVESDVKFEAGKKLDTVWGEFTMYDRLSDVPNNELGCIVGSSGLGRDRFLELVVQGKSAEDKFGARIGDHILPHTDDALSAHIAAP